MASGIDAWITTGAEIRFSGKKGGALYTHREDGLKVDVRLMGPGIVRLEVTAYMSVASTSAEPVGMGPDAGEGRPLFSVAITKGTLYEVKMAFQEMVALDTDGNGSEVRWGEDAQRLALSTWEVSGYRA